MTLSCNAQISVDSLLTNIYSSYTETGSKNYLSETFTIFESQDRKDRYDIFLDSTNQIDENIGLSIVHYSYDKLNRIQLIEGFNKEGYRSYWDFPEKQIFRYVIDTLVPEINKIKNEICNCQNPEILSDVIVIKEINTDTVYNKIRISIISKDSTEKLSYSICSNGKLCNKAENTFYIYRKFHKKNKSKIIHERFYDAGLKLVDGKHGVNTSEFTSYFPPGTSYAYSIREIKNGEVKTINFYDKNGSLVETKHYGISIGPINTSE